MKLKSFNKKNTYLKRPGICSVNFHKEGIISFSKRACEVIGLLEGTPVEIFQDEDNAEDWYISKSDESKGFLIRRTKEMACFSSAFTTKEIFESINAGNIISVTFMISETGIEYEGKLLYPIITKSAKIKE